MKQILGALVVVLTVGFFGGCASESDGTCSDGNCDCAKGETCHFKCTHGNCSQQCADGSNCTTTCAGGNCRQSCDPGAKCDFSCEGGGCQQACLGSADCTASCGAAVECTSDVGTSVNPGFGGAAGYGS